MWASNSRAPEATRETSTVTDQPRSRLLALIDNSQAPPKDEISSRILKEPEAYPQSFMERVFARAIATQEYYEDHPERLVEQTKLGTCTVEGAILVARAIVTLVGLALNVPSVVANIHQASAVATVTGGSVTIYSVAILLPVGLAGLFAILSLWYSVLGHKSSALRFSVLGSFSHAFIFYGLWVWGIGGTPLAIITLDSVISWATQAANDIQLFTVMVVNLYHGDGKLWANRPVSTFGYVAGGMVLTILAMVLGVHSHGLNLSSGSAQITTCALGHQFRLQFHNVTGDFLLDTSSLLSSGELYETGGTWILMYTSVGGLDFDNVTVTIGQCLIPVPNVTINLGAVDYEVSLSAAPYMCTGDSVARPANYTIYSVTTGSPKGYANFVGCPLVDELAPPTLTPTTPPVPTVPTVPTVPPVSATFVNNIVLTVQTEAATLQFTSSQITSTYFASYYGYVYFSTPTNIWTQLDIYYLPESACNWTTPSLDFVWIISSIELSPHRFPPPPTKAKHS